MKYLLCLLLLLVACRGPETEVIDQSSPGIDERVRRIVSLCRSYDEAVTDRERSVIRVEVWTEVIVTDWDVLPLNVQAFIEENL